jgi:hypothetical protein
VITLLTARLKTCVSAEKGWDDGRCASDKKPIEDDEKLESWSSDRQDPKAGRSFETRASPQKGKRAQAVQFP